MTAAGGSFGSSAAPTRTPGESRLPARIIVIGLVLGIVVGGLLGAVAGAVQSRSYQATTIASVLPDDALTTAATVAGTTSTEDSSDFIQGELVVITSQGLRSKVQQRLKLGGLPSVSASQSGTTDIVDITATAGSPALAQRVANATRIVYAQQRSQELMSDVATASTQVENQITAVRKQIAATPGAAANSNSPLEQEYARLLAVDSELALDAAQSASAVTTIQPAVVGGGGLSDTATYGLGGVVLGILVAAAGMVALRRLRPRVYDGRDLVGFGADVLTPVLPAERSRAARAARVLSNGMRGGAGSDPAAVVLVGTGSGAGSQRAVAALTLAYHDASPVLVLARPGTVRSLLAELPSGTQLVGASELVTKRATTTRLGRLATDAGEVRLAVVDASTVELTALASADFLATATDAGWAVVADAPPLGESRLAVVLAGRTGAATVLVAQGVTDPSDVEATVAALQGAGIPRLTLLLYAQPSVRQRLARRVGRREPDRPVVLPAGAPAPTGTRPPRVAAPAAATPTPPAPAGSPASPTVTAVTPGEHPVATKPGAVSPADNEPDAVDTRPPTRPVDAIGNVRPVRALDSGKTSSATTVSAAVTNETTNPVPKPVRVTKRVRGEST